MIYLLLLVVGLLTVAVVVALSAQSKPQRARRSSAHLSDDDLGPGHDLLSDNDRRDRAERESKGRHGADDDRGDDGESDAGDGGDGGADD